MKTIINNALFSLNSFLAETYLVLVYKIDFFDVRVIKNNDRCTFVIYKKPMYTYLNNK